MGPLLLHLKVRFPILLKICYFYLFISICSRLFNLFSFLLFLFNIQISYSMFCILINDNHFFLPMISSFQSYSTLRTCLFTHLCIYSSLPPSTSFSYLISLTSNFFLLHFSKFSSIMRTYRCCQQSHPLLHHSCLSSTPLPHSYTMLHLVRNLFLCFLPLVTTIILLRILFKIYFVPF